jgi:chromosome segregation ATPase
LRKSTGLFILMVAAAAAQDKPPEAAPSPQELAAKKSAEWEALAGNLEAKIARMLPCDARVRTSIEEVSRASDSRVAALAQSLQEAAAQARRDAEAARSALAEQEMHAREMEAERAEAEQEQAAVDAQLADLSENAKRRAALDGAMTKLESIAASLKQRVATAEEQNARRASLTASLRDLVGSYDARLQALETSILAASKEATRWKEYYAARVARAQTECSLTNQAPRRQPKKKQ